MPSSVSKCTSQSAKVAIDKEIFMENYPNFGTKNAKNTKDIYREVSNQATSEPPEGWKTSVDAPSNFSGPKKHLIRPKTDVASSNYDIFENSNSEIEDFHKYNCDKSDIDNQATSEGAEHIKSLLDTSSNFSAPLDESKQANIDSGSSNSCICAGGVAKIGV